MRPKKYSKRPLCDRFWVKVEKGDFNDCWRWKAVKNQDGYGCIKVDGRMLSAPRVCWRLCFGEIPENLQVLHRCDNRACVNPDRLYLGTPKDNATDMCKRNRLRIPRKKGEEHGRAKLTENQVKEIIRLSEPQIWIAAKYGISQSHVSQIKLEKSWKHLAK